MNKQMTATTSADEVEDILKDLVKQVSRARTNSSASDVAGEPGNSSANLDDNSFGLFDSIARNVDFPALIIAKSGRIAAANSAGNTFFEASENAHIDDLLEEFSTGETASHWISRKLAADVSDMMDNHAEARIKSTHATVRLGIGLPSYTQLPPGFAMLFVVQAPWSLQLQSHIKTAFGLTKSEASILEAFSSGADLKRIAQSRDRSLTTVRKQFYQVLEKCGVKTQVDLMHLVFEIHQYLETTSKLISKNANPLRQELSLPRPDGRTLQVAIAGDRAGSAIVTIAFAGRRCFPASFEKQLHEANLQLLSISPPGFGSTSKHHKDDDFAQVASDDLTSLLDQLGIEDVVILADGPTLFQAVDFAKRQPDRVRNIVSTIPFLPTALINRKQKNVSFFDNLMVAFAWSPRVRKFAAEALIRAFFKMDIDAFLHLAYGRRRGAVDAIKNSGMAQEIEDSMRMATEQGADTYLAYMNRSYEDWPTALAETNTQLTVYRPKEGGLGNEFAYQELASSYTKNVSYLTLQASSADHCMEYPQEFIHVLKQCFSGLPQSTSGNMLELSPFGREKLN